MLNLKTEDIIHFEKLQKDYDNTINYYNDLAEHMEEWKPSIKTNERFLTENGLKHDIGLVKADEKNKVTKDFIKYIFRYFQNNYGLSSLSSYIESNILKKYIEYNFTDYKGKNDNLHYNQIIKDICQALNINDFDNAELNDLRKRIVDKMKYYWEHERINVNKNKIKVTDFGFSINSNWNNTEFNIADSTVNCYKDIASALNYINTGKLEAPEQFKIWLKDMNTYDKRKISKDFYTTHNINILGVDSLRFYKNRSLEIKFHNEEDIKKFIRVLKGDF